MGASPLSPAKELSDTTPRDNSLPKILQKLDENDIEFNLKGKKSDRIRNLDSILNQPKDYSSGPDSMFDNTSPVNGSNVSIAMKSNKGSFFSKEMTKND